MKSTTFLIVIVCASLVGQATSLLWSDKLVWVESIDREILELVDGPVADSDQETKISKQQLLENFTSDSDSDGDEVNPITIAFSLSEIKNVDAELIDGLTVGQILDQNHIKDNDCSVEALKKRLEFSEMIKEDDQHSPREHIRAYCREALEEIAKDCSINDDYKPIVYKGQPDRKFMDELREAIEKSEDERFEQEQQCKISFMFKRERNTLEKLIADYGTVESS